MAHLSSQWVAHTITGGWATDYGTTYYASPQNGNLNIPWCKTCENIKFYPDGSFGKHPGTTSLVNAPIKAPATTNGFLESSKTRFLYDYVRMGTSLVGTRIRVAIVGAWLYDISNSTPTLIGNVGAVAGRVYHMTTFNDLLIIGGVSPPKSWDQTTFQSLAGSPPSFSFSTPHAGRHWAAGNTSAPSRLYYSAVGNPEDWTGSGSGSIDVDPGDGDAIVGLLSWKKELWVFKGPNRLSIHRITGADPTTFTREPFMYGISAAGHTSIFPVGDDFAFWSPRGSCHSLTATASYGDYTQAYINFPILSWCRNPENLVCNVASATWQSITDAAQNITYSVFNTDFGLVAPPLLLVMDWRFRSEGAPYPRFIVLTLDPGISAIGMTSGKFDSSQLVATFGNTSGMITQELPPQVPFLYNNGESFPYRLETPDLTYGPSCYTKTIAGISVDVVNNFNTQNNAQGTLSFSYGGRGAPTQTLSLSNTPGNGLDAFVLDQDQLDSGGNVPDYTEAASGEATAFSYTLAENSPLILFAGTDVRVHHFNVLITPSGESLENH